MDWSAVGVYTVGLNVWNVLLEQREEPPSELIPSPCSPEAPEPPSTQTALSSSLPQVYTRLHLIPSDPRAEASHFRRLRVRVRPERLVAVPYVGRVCREPAEADLGAGALHRRVSYHEVGITLFVFLFLGLVFSTWDPLWSPLSTETVACSCWCSPQPTWRLRASGSLSRSACRQNPPPTWRRVDHSILEKLCNFPLIQSTYNLFIYLLLSTGAKVELWFSR